ncbi:MAG: hypothetical protein RL662_1818 [Bacteroidota bacterium]|jgi:protein tyrosine/serine phosphatase
MKKFTVLFLIFMTISTVSSANDSRNPKWATKVDNILMDNMYLIDDGVYRSEQPSAKDFNVLKDFGILEVLNLRNYHNDEDEASGTNMTLHHVRMAAHRIITKNIIKSLQIIKNRKGSILIHCRHGSDRTGVVVAMYRIVFQNWSKEDAIDELKNGEYGYHRIYINIIRFINNADIEAIKKEIEML